MGNTKIIYTFVFNWNESAYVISSRVPNILWPEEAAYQFFSAGFQNNYEQFTNLKLVSFISRYYVEDEIHIQGKNLGVEAAYWIFLWKVPLFMLKKKTFGHNMNTYRQEKKWYHYAFNWQYWNSKKKWSWMFLLNKVFCCNQTEFNFPVFWSWHILILKKRPKIINLIYTKQLNFRPQSRPTCEWILNINCTCKSMLKRLI